MELKNKKDKQAFWITHFKNWEASGISQRQYCANQGIKFGTFQYYRHRLHQSTPPSINFVEVQPPVKMKSPGDCALQLMMPNGIRLSIPVDIPESLLKMVITLAGQTRC